MTTEKQIDFPELPSPVDAIEDDDRAFFPVFTAQQMRDYVKADRAQRQAGQSATGWFVSGPKLHRTVYLRGDIEPAVSEMVDADPNSDRDDYTATALYTAPPPAQVPLTDRQAYDAIVATVDNPEPFDKAVTDDSSGWAEAMQLVRAIEQAHGIGKGQA